MSTDSSTDDATLHNFIHAMEDVYGPLSTLSPSEAETWTPPPASSGHLGRYLWTDAFGVLNLLTLYHATKSTSYLHCASRLVDTVHNILGLTRTQDEQLPGASPEHPLAGGLRIGKDNEFGPDGDGQYHHYLTLWMFALNRLSIVKGDEAYNGLAIELAKATHPAFVVNRDAARPRMRWKMSVDLSRPLVSSEGNLDPIDGYVVFSLLQKTAGNSMVLKEEISDYKKIVDAKYQLMVSDDPLDLGMTLWTVHWLATEETWANVVLERAKNDLRKLAFTKQYFKHHLERRLAFREFGTCLGVKCAASPTEIDLTVLSLTIIDQWEKAGMGSSDTMDRGLLREGLKPITNVMYAASLIPGVFSKEFPPPNNL